MSLIKKLGIGILGIGLLGGCEIKIGSKDNDYQYSNPIQIEGKVLSKKGSSEISGLGVITTLTTGNPMFLGFEDEKKNIEFGNDKLKFEINNRYIFNEYEIGDYVKITYRDVYRKDGNIGHQFLSAQKK